MYLESSRHLELPMRGHFNAGVSHTQQTCHVAGCLILPMCVGRDWNANSLPPLGLVNADPGDVTTYTGPLQPGWLTIQWIKINNLTDVLTNNPFYSAPAADASGGGFGLR